MDCSDMVAVWVVVLIGRKAQSSRNRLVSMSNRFFNSFFFISYLHFQKKLDFLWIRVVNKIMLPFM